MYVTLLHEKNPYFSENNSLMTPFLLCLRASDKHYFSKYWGKDAWIVPLHLKFGGDSPPRSSPMLFRVIWPTNPSSRDACNIWVGVGFQGVSIDFGHIFIHF